MDTANFNTRIDGQKKRVNDQSLMSWVKLISWRVNGDGCGGYIPIEDSFLRTSDDSTYVRDWRRRCTFWKDTNANQCRHINHIAGGVEECDILYSRFHDRLSNPRHLINLDAAETFSGLTFENMAFYLPLNKKLSVITRTTLKQTSSWIKVFLNNVSVTVSFYHEIHEKHEKIEILLFVCLLNLFTLSHAD